MSSDNSNNNTIVPSLSHSPTVENDHQQHVAQSQTDNSCKTIEYNSMEGLSNDLEQLINSPVLSDVIFKVGAHQVFAHKILLVQRSRYFRAMFLNTGFLEGRNRTTSDASSDDVQHRRVDKKGDEEISSEDNSSSSSNSSIHCTATVAQEKRSIVMTNQEHCIITIDNFELDVFLKVIRYLYCGKVQFEQSLNTDAMSVLGAADYFQCEELKAYCVEHLQNLISEECALDILQLANSFCCEELIDTCFDFIAGNTQDVLESEAFTQLDVHTLHLVLESEFLASDEIHVFTALLRYSVMCLYDEITHDRSDRTDREKRENEELIKKLFTRFEASVNRDRTSLSKMARRTSCIGEQTDHHVNNIKLRDAVNDDQLPDVQIKKFNGGYEAFISNLGRALQSTRYKQRFQEIVSEHVSLIRFPLMTAEQLTNVVEPLDIVPDKYMLEAYRFHCATGVVNKSKKTASNNTMASSPVTTASPNSSKTQFSIRCQARKGAHQPIEFDGSKILSEQNKRTLTQWCEVGPNNKYKKKKKWALAYSATRDGFSASTFHKLCDSRGPSVTVARTTDGFIFGGYNSSSWSSTTCWKAATDTFLFSLVNPYNDGPRKLKVKNNQRAVYNHQSFGPTFGGGGNMSYFDPYDIYIDASMSHGHTNVGNSYSTFRGGWRSDEAQRSLAGSLNSWTLNECEVFVLQ